MANAKKNEQSVVALVLAFSREDDLKKVIHNLKNQTRKLDEIIVLFQGTSSVILSWLEKQSGITLVHQENYGTAGGFTRGIKLAIEKGHQWTWLLDDDAVPELDALEALVNCKYFNSKITGFLASVVVNPERKVYMSPVAEEANNWYGSVLEDGCVPVTSATWIGCLISMQSIFDFGLPIEEYFMYDEDYEYTSRVARSRDCYCVIKSVTVHYQSSKFDPFSNKIDMLKHGYYVRNHFATIRLGPKSVVRRAFKLWRWFYKNAKQIVLREVPFKTIIPLFQGLLLFRPKVKYFKK